MYPTPKTIFCVALLSVSAFASFDEIPDYRSLTAVTRRSHLYSRDVDFTPQWNSEFHYVDENSLSTDSPFAASLGVSSRLPTLALEEVEMHLDRVHCSATAIEISFTSGHHYERAREAWEDLSNFFVITSHPGCNYNGERSPYLVSSVTFFEGQLTAILSTQVMDWKDTFYSMTVDFGISSEAYSPGRLRHHGSLQGRQVASTTSAATSPTLAYSASQSYPAAPTNLPSATNVSYGLNFSQVGTQIFPPNIPGAGLLLPQGWTVSCKNCTAKGSVDLTHGTFTTTSNSSSSIKEVINFIETGFVTLTMNNFSAYIELETAVQASQQLKEFDVHLLAVPIPISPFTIPGIASVGAFFDPVLVASVTISEALNFTYGFDLTVPDGSFVTIDIGNITESSTAGFGKTKVNALPFQATAGDIGLTFSAAFRPQTLLGIEIFNGNGGVDVDFFFDLPQVSVLIEQLTNVDKTCVPSNATNDIGDELGHIFGNLTHVSPSVDLDVGVGLSAGLEIGGEGTAVTTVWTILSTVYSLPTACLSYDQRGGTFAPASDPPAIPTATGINREGGTTKKGDGVRAENPFKGRWGKWQAYGVVLVAAFSIF